MSDQANTTRAEDARVLIPLSQLAEGKFNVRRTDKKADVPSLAADIHAHGLLQNLLVTDNGDSHFGVEAGGRRLAALKMLAKQKKIDADHPVPCAVISAAEAEELSLAENIQHEAMNPMDEAEAFARRIADGVAVEEIARRFGKTVRHVEQRLALARLSPKIRNAFRRRDLTLDAARAFCLTDDHGEQERVLRQLGKPLTDARAVRQALTHDRVPISHKLAKFVGVEAYEAAGGRVTRDMFDDTQIYLDDGDLLVRLAGQKLETLREQTLVEGWGWVDARLNGGNVDDGCVGERIRATQRRLTAKERKAIATLDSRIADLDARLEEADEDNPLWRDRESLADQRDEIRESATVWDKALMPHAGAVVYLDYNGDVVIQRGLIKRADKRTIDKLRHSADAKTDADAPSSPSDGAPEESSGPRYSKALTRQLTQARTRAIRSEIATRPRVALALAVHVLLQRSLARESVDGVRIESRPIGFDDNDGFERARTALTEQLPENADERLDACLAATPDALLDMLALLVAETLDLTHEGASGNDAAMQRLTDTLAAAVDLDMTRHWEPDREFFERAPKTLVLEALETAPAFQRASAKKQADKRAAWARMKKTERAVAAATALRGTRWLPDVLVTPLPAGAVAVTPEGEAELAASAA